MNNNIEGQAVSGIDQEVAAISAKVAGLSPEEGLRYLMSLDDSVVRSLWAHETEVFNRHKAVVGQVETQRQVVQGQVDALRSQVKERFGVESLQDLHDKMQALRKEDAEKLLALLRGSHERQPQITAAEAILANVKVA